MNKTKVTTFSLIGIFIIVLLICWINFDLIIRYYHYSKIHHFAVDDKLYIKEKKFKDTSYKALMLYRLVRPINDKDLENLRLDQSSRELIKKQSKTLIGKKLISSNETIFLDSLRKHGNTLIGSFIKKEFINILSKDNKKGTLLTYAIKPIKNIIVSEHHSNDDIPQGYIYADNYLYVMYFDVVDKPLNKSN